MTPDEQVEHWEARLRSEGLGPLPTRKQVRAPRSLDPNRRAVSREVPMDPEGDITLGGPLWDQPATWLQAAISHDPYTQAASVSIEELAPLRDAIHDAIDQLPEAHRDLMHAISSGLSIREAGELQGVTYGSAYQKYGEAKKQLRAALEHHPAVRPHLRNP